MNKILSVLSCLAILIFSITRAEEEIVTSNFTETVCQPEPCDCIITDLRNLQSQVDSCRSQESKNSKAIKMYEEKNMALEKIIERNESDAQENLLKERNEFQIQIASLEAQIAKLLEEKSQNMADWSDEKKELQNQLKDSESQVFKAIEEKSKINTHWTNKFEKASDEISSLKVKKMELEQEHDMMKAQLTAIMDDKEKCQLSLDETEKTHKKVTEERNEFETKKANIEKRHASKVKDLRKQIANMNKELDQRKTSLRSMQDRYHDTREELTNLDRELRMMHIRAQRTYFNTTLVREDAMRFFYKGVDKSVMFAEDVIANKKAQSTYKKFKNTLKELVNPFIPLYKKYIRPQMSLVGEKLKGIDAIEGVRLLIISMIEQGSTICLNYIELTKGNSLGSRRFQSRSSKMLTYTKKNAETIVHSVCQVILVYLACKLLVLVIRLVVFGIARALLTTAKRTKVKTL